MVGDLRGRQTQFYIDILYGIAFALGFGYLLLFGMDVRVAAFQAGLVFGYFLRVWENMHVYERILEEEIASEAEAQVEEEIESQVPEQVEAEIETQVPAHLEADVEQHIAEEVETQIGDIDDHIDERVTEQIDGPETSMGDTGGPSA